VSTNVRYFGHFQVLWITWRGRFEAHSGHAKNVASLKRTADFSVDYNADTGAITVFGSFGLSELDVSRFPFSPGYFTTSEV
jgi:hypothetical protein